MWSWNITDAMELSHLHGNLVVRFTSYITAEPFLTFLGTNKIDKTAEQLLVLSQQLGLRPILELVPEIAAQKLNPDLFTVAEDPNHTDYVLSVDKLSTYEGAELAGKRRLVSQFTRRTPVFRFVLLDINESEVEMQIRKLFSLWLVQKNIASIEEEEHEYKALRRCLESDFKADLIATGVYVNDVLSAFWIIEDLGNSYSISHFEKADTTAYGGVFAFLKLKTGEVLRDRGIKYINLEQDLGITGLRISKKSYFPQLFLKKYTVVASGPLL
jgi:hypothetical protein